MAEQQSSHARELLAKGEVELKDQLFQDAMQSFKEAQTIFEDTGDNTCSLIAFSKVLSVLIAKGDTEQALAMAQEKKLQFEATWNLNGEICMLEQIISAHNAAGNTSAAAEVAKRAIGHFKQYTARGIDSTSGQAYMWLTVARSCLKEKNIEDAMEAATTAAQLFSELGEYDNESVATKLYNVAHESKGKNTYLVADKHAFYLGVRMGGIAYGPRYRDNHNITIKPDGASHVATCLQLTCEEAEEWEHDVGFHGGLIDAGAHASFANSLRPDNLAAAAEAAKDPSKATGPTIPYAMDHGELCARSDTSDMYLNISGEHIYMFRS